MIEWIKEWWFLLVVAIILGLMILVELGCAGNKAPLPALDDTSQIIKEVYKTNKVAVLFIVGIAAGVFLLIQGNKMGLAVIIACSGGLYALASYQAFATHPYLPSVVAVCGLLAGVGWFAYREWIRRQATSKLVEYGEHAKNYGREEVDDKIRQEDWKTDHAPKSKAVQKEIDKVIKKNGK